MPKHSQSLEVAGTFLQGYTQATTRAELVALFGEPTFYEIGDKVTLEWCLDFGGGIIATIYDWKRYEEGTPALDEEMKYNIGGNSPLSVEKVKEAIEEEKKVSA